MPLRDAVYLAFKTATGELEEIQEEREKKDRVSQK